MRPWKQWIGLVAVAWLGLVVVAPSSSAAEIYSNGKGGGPWSDPTTWRGKAAPGPEDDVVIARGDEVIFDRNDDRVALLETGAAMIGSARLPDLGAFTAGATLLAGSVGKASCHKLFLDPKSLLSFKTGAGKQTLCVAGPVEAFGTIKLDAHNNPKDFLELRLIGDTQAKRIMHLKKGAALLLTGAADPRERRRNVAITSWPQPLLKIPTVDADCLGTVEGQAESMIDVQRAEVVNIFLTANYIDNTGAKANERINVAESRFSQFSRLYCVGCDTPLIVHNYFDCGDASLPTSAINLYASPLAEVRGNRIRGRYTYGIQGTAQTDSVVTDNTIENCSGGIYWYGTNGMIKQATIKGCDTGVAITSMSGAIDDVTVEGAKTGLYHGGADAQVSNFRVTKLQKDGIAVDYYSGPLTLLNCNIRPEQIRVAKQAPEPKPPEFLVQSMQFLVVGVKGDLAADMQVEVTTANPTAPLAPGAADLNVRNSPAVVHRNGMTNLPKTLEPVIVKSWIIDANGKVVPAPEYVVKVLGPAGGEKGERPVFKTMKVKPEERWFRDKPDVPTATLEVPLK